MAEAVAVGLLAGLAVLAIYWIRFPEKLYRSAIQFPPHSEWHSRFVSRAVPIAMLAFVALIVAQLIAGWGRTG